MNMNKRIAKFLITLTSFTMMTSVNAYQGSDCGNPCANYDPCCPSPARSFYGEVDYIYWGVQEDGLRFAQTGFGRPFGETSNDACGCSNNNCGNSHNHDISWNSGFKVGAGFANPCSDWEMFVQYTWYRANPKKCAGGGDTLIPQFGIFDRPLIGEFINLTRANSQWHFRFNNIDALITNEFAVNNCFSFRPSFGLKGAWLRQQFSINYGLDAAELPLGAASEYTVYHKQDFWGIGPKFALTASASLFDSFSLYGNLGLSTLWGQYRLHRDDNEINLTVAPGVSDTIAVVRACSNRNRVQAVLESTIGVRWDTDLCCGDYGFYVDIAWEQQVWWNHNNFIDLDVNHNHGDLTLQGLTVGAGFSF